MRIRTHSRSALALMIAVVVLAAACVPAPQLTTDTLDLGPSGSFSEPEFDISAEMRMSNTPYADSVKLVVTASREGDAVRTFEMTIDRAGFQPLAPGNYPGALDTLPSRVFSTFGPKGPTMADFSAFGSVNISEIEFGELGPNAMDGTEIIYPISRLRGTVSVAFADPRGLVWGSLRIG